MKALNALIVASACSLMATSPCPGGDQKAKTEGGKDVILHDDGTWVYAGDAAGKDKKSALAYTGKRGTFGLHLVPGVWKKADKPNNKVAEVEFHHKDGDAYAMVIAERVTVPLNLLKKAVLAQMKSVDKDAELIKEEMRVVNGNDVLCLTIQVTTEGLPLTFHGYYYSGEAGSIQVVTWTGRNIFEEVKPELDAFLNGFETIKKKK